MTNNAHSFNQETQKISQGTDQNRTNDIQNATVCNCCGRKIPVYPSPDARECVEIIKKWGFFSGKDGEIHQFHICESCYDAWIATFAIAPEVTEDTELM